MVDINPGGGTQKGSFNWPLSYILYVAACRHKGTLLYQTAMGDGDGDESGGKRREVLVLVLLAVGKTMKG